MNSICTKYFGFASEAVAVVDIEDDEDDDDDDD